MTDLINTYGQPIGFAVPDWQPGRHPRGSKLYGRLCRLEPVTLDQHAGDLAAAFAHDDGRNWTYMPYGPLRGEDEVRQWMESTCLSDDPCFFALVDLATGKAVGVASYLRIDPELGVIEVGHIHFSPLIQGTALATEAMYLMMRHVFDTLGYRRYEWKCDALNQPSRAAALRLGFVFEGIFRQATMYKQRNRDTAWFALVDCDWARVKVAFENWLDPGNFDADGRQLTRLSEQMARISA